jgi:hypothetical protein
MISSLLSSFEFTHRRALLLSAQKAAVYHWVRGELGDSFLFDATDQGRDYFRRYLVETPNWPMYIIVDVFEEEFRLDTIPHVYGSDRAAVLARKKGRLFRDTPYFHYRVLGREEEGRRDDRVMLSAIGNPLIVRPWVECLDEAKVPVAGVYSIPQYSPALLKLLPDPGDNVLLISMESIAGLRQTFLHKNDVRVSRLIQLPRYGTEPYGPRIRDEVEKIRRYLSNLRLPGIQDAIDIYILAAGELLPELRNAYRASGTNRYYILDINDLLAAAGSSRKVSTPFSDQLFVYEILKNRPANVYAQPADRRYFTMRRWRYAMLAASACLLLGGAAWGGFSFLNGLTHKQQSLAAQQKTSFYSARYELARERLPHTPVEPADIKIAVDLAATLGQYKTTPLPALKLIAGALEQRPEVQIESIQWAASTNPLAGTDPNQANRGAAAGRPVTVAAAPLPGTPQYRYYQIAIIDGRIDPFDGDFRAAIDLINQLAETLRQQAGVHEVQVLTLPLDVSSSASLQGTTQTERREAVFSMRLVVGIGNEA